jgi:hypothetical protein
MVQSLARNWLRLLSDRGSTAKGLTHDRAYFNPDSDLRMLSARRIEEYFGREVSFRGQVQDLMSRQVGCLPIC